MTKLLVLMLAMSGQVWSAASFLGCWGLNQTSSAATSVSVSVSPAGGSGHLLVGIAGHGSNNTSTIAFADGSGSNTWSAASTLIDWSANASRMWYANNVAGGTYNVTVTFGASVNYNVVSVCEYSGMVTSSPLDVARNVGSSTTPHCDNKTTCTTGTFTTTTANDLIVFMLPVNNPGYSVGSIGGVTASWRASNSNRLAVEDLSVTSVQTNITAAITSTTLSYWGGTAAAFKVATTPVTVTTASLPNGTVGAAYSQSLAASGGTGPYTWSVTAGSISPFSLASGGAVTGTPVGTGTSSFTVTATDSLSAVGTQALSIVVNASASATKRRIY